MIVDPPNIYISIRILCNLEVIYSLVILNMRVVKPCTPSYSTGIGLHSSLLHERYSM